MKVEDEAFFYHTGNERRIMGVVEVIREAYPDPTDPSGRFIMVDVKTITSLQHPISLAQIKAEPFLAHLPLLRQSRLSVMPIDSSSWSFIKKWGGL
jgi:predicted RNA-binding protein with PUA-like domain